MPIDTRHYDKNSEISRMHGTNPHAPKKPTVPNFAGRSHKLDEPSLSRLIGDHVARKLEQICRS